MNNNLRHKKCALMMMGPGRWGSNNIELGINVGYADIVATAILAEVAFEKAGHTPEVSYGTHFFQDLVESNILYLPVYPDEPGTEFNNKFFTQSPNIITDLVPELKEYEDVIHVIDVPRATGGAMAKVVADLQTRDAICFLDIKETLDKKIKRRKGK